ncbi:MAG: hypothetical protein QOG20_1312 [Pseudonocardiales bacterium]|jgi:hypothetical protein|nr:hypothetical protein [Pseudonocardiales bacterium]
MPLRSVRRSTITSSARRVPRKSTSRRRCTTRPARPHGRGGRFRVRTRARPGELAAPRVRDGQGGQVVVGAVIPANWPASATPRGVRPAPALGPPVRRPPPRGRPRAPPGRTGSSRWRGSQLGPGRVHGHRGGLQALGQGEAAAVAEGELGGAGGGPEPGRGHGVVGGEGFDAQAEDLQPAGGAVGVDAVHLLDLVDRGAAAVLAAVQDLQRWPRVPQQVPGRLVPCPMWASARATSWQVATPLCSWLASSGPVRPRRCAWIALTASGGSGSRFFFPPLPADPNGGVVAVFDSRCDRIHRWHRAGAGRDPDHVPRRVA